MPCRPCGMHMRMRLRLQCVRLARVGDEKWRRSAERVWRRWDALDFQLNCCVSVRTLLASLYCAAVLCCAALFVL